MMTAEEELKEYMEEAYSDKTMNVMEQAIRFKFPKIGGINITIDRTNRRRMTISFDDDGSYTKQEVEQFLHELKQFGK